MTPPGFYVPLSRESQEVPTREPVIVGMDPGTTTAVAIFGLDGALLTITSRRGFARAALRKLILEQGSPVVIASDVSPLPKAVGKAVASFSALPMLPEQPLGWRDKKRILEAFCKDQVPAARPWRNVHERDALIAGFRAWKRLRPRLQKIDQASVEAVRASLLAGRPGELT